MRYSLLFVLFVSYGVAQSVYTRPSTVTFDTSVTTQKDSAAIWIVNTTNNGVYFYDINIFGEAFSVKDTSFFIPSNDSAKTWLYFSSIHNLTYNDFAFIETNLPTGSIVVPISGTKKYAEPLYKSTQGLSGEPLKTALNTIIKIGQKSLGYSTSYPNARDRMFLDIDNEKVNGQGATVNTLECIYTGRKIEGFTDRIEAQNSTYNFNTEHTWPQGTFSEAEPMRSDIHHLFPTDETANNKRNNYSFGVVPGTATWSVGGSKLGSGYGGYTVFEPRDAHKGDCARAMFYFIIRYPNNYGNFWTESPYQETAFRDWNKKFPPTAKSMARNNSVQLYQGNRNPFIDHPELVDRINNFGGTATVVTSAQLVASPAVLSFGDIFSVNNPNKKLTLANVGDKALTISSISFTNSSYVLDDTVTFLDAKSYRVVTVTSNALPNGDTTGTMTITYNDGSSKQLVVGLSGYVVTGVRNQQTPPADFVLHQNFPNPFNPLTQIEFTIHVSGFTVLKIYNALGKEITTLVRKKLEAGEYNVQFDAAQLPSGIYFYTLQSGAAVETKKMLLLK